MTSNIGREPVPYVLETRRKKSFRKKGTQLTTKHHWVSSKMWLMAGFWNVEDTDDVSYIFTKLLHHFYRSLINGGRDNSILVYIFSFIEKFFSHISWLQFPPLPLIPPSPLPSGSTPFLCLIRKRTGFYIGE